MVNFSALLLSFAVFINVKCSMRFNEVKIRIPSDFSGWCYIVPGRSETNEFGFYSIDSNGVCIIPATNFGKNQNMRIRVFSGTEEITGKDQYTGKVEGVNKSGVKYVYYQFFVPPITERDINDQAYWRKRQFEISQKKKYDSLVTAGIIVID